MSLDCVLACSYPVGRDVLLHTPLHFIALSFFVTTSENIFMDYYQKSLPPAIFQRGLTCPKWEPCTIVLELLNIAFIVAPQAEAIVASHLQHSHTTVSPKKDKIKSRRK